MGKRQTTADAETADDDQALAARAKSDRVAFGVLYDRYVTRVYGYCYRRLSTKEAAEDATSHVFMRALNAMPSYRTSNPSFGAWLFRIAHNVVVDELRSRRSLSGGQQIDSAIRDRSPGPEDVTMNTEAMGELANALSMLSPDQARVVELRLAGLNDREIAFALGKSFGSVRVAKHRAVKRLRTILHDEADGSGDV